MTKTQTTISSQTKIAGSVEVEGDLVVLGQITGGPLRVAGRLFIGRSGSVSSEDTEVHDALVLGVFSGTLKAREAVRIHQTGRLLGEVVANRVSFVTDAQLQGLLGANFTEGAQSLPPSKVVGGKAPPSAATPPPLAGNAPPPLAPPAPAPVAMAHAEPPPAPSVRMIPPLPTLGSRAMRRRE